ncbi:Bromodomain containing protein [Histomonas meleagridis]|uniref:Bromodomain containing protein n=1 Tax=Histomonas meleagridis TaxID=135588 RepID=UPI003559EDCC|nr:Bromodomain containing protein [Histomonas meleagridis]KAH0805928.1 Bromodomain containing protein [Histomonas meleagridis]
MDSNAYDFVRSITEKIVAIPTNADFAYPLEDIVPGYRDYIENPMDLSTVQKKLKDNKYKTVREWYEDVCRIYDNCVKYYTESNQPPDRAELYITLANYNLKRFKKLTPGLECKSDEEWYELTRKTNEKLIKIAGNSPIPQGIDPMLPDVSSFAEPLMPLTPREIAETVDSLNRWMDQDHTKKDIVLLLKQNEPEMKFDVDLLTIDAEKLKEETLKALWVYVKSHKT